VLEDLTRSFVAVIMSLVLRHRQANGDAGNVEAYVSDVKTELGRYRKKVEGIRAEQPKLRAECDRCQNTFEHMANLETGRAIRLGLVDFTPIARAGEGNGVPAAATRHMRQRGDTSLRFKRRRNDG
jgi:hypothetical protein